jgi:peptidoglycan/xylan/chitin deacetylase (PgdA/CDA1 family)
MKQFRNNVIRAGLEALYFTGAHRLMRPLFAGVGAIFMLHHVRPRGDADFQPNHHLEVTPEFLRRMLTHLRSHGIDIITMDEVHRRLIDRDFSRRFACFTLDDGYRDNRDFALPVMREFDAPFIVYVASDFAAGTGRLWWVALERVIARASSIEARIGDVATRLDTSTPAAKQEAFDRLHDWLRSLPGEHDVAREISALCASHGFDELALSRARIESALQRPVLHLAYPYGDKIAAGPREFALARASGFKTAVTTRPGMIFPESADHLTALQRVSLNGNYQDTRFLPVLTSGAATAFGNGFRRIDAA